MRKSMLVFLLVVGVATGTSLAVSLTTLPVTNAGVTNTGGANYHVQGLTDDGAYVIASKNDGTQNYSTIIKVSDGSTTYLGTRVTGGRGIGLWSGGFVTAACAEQNAPTNTLGLAWGAGQTNYNYLQTANESWVAHNNAVAIDPVTGNGWIAGRRSAVNGQEAYAWTVTAGVVNIATAYNKVGSGNTGFSGISTTGIAVGGDKSGPGGVDGPILADVANNGNPYKINAYPGSLGRGGGNGISNNGAYATGNFYTPPGVTSDALHAFRNTVAGNTSVELLPAGGDDLTIAQQSNGFDVSDNGTVGGFSYKGKTAAGVQRPSYDATIWFPGETNGVLLQDILAANGVGLGDFSSLERIISVTSDGLTFSGRGVLAADGSYRGFVATIPEPATMGLVALGGLVLLRRRSR